MRGMKLEPIIQSEVNQKEKHQFCILRHVYGIRKMVRMILDVRQQKGYIPIFLFLPNKSITVSAGLDLLFVVYAHSAFLMPCLLMYSVISLLSLFVSSWSVILSQGTLWGLGWKHLFQRYLYLLLSGSCMKVYFKLTFVVQTNFWTTKVRQNQPQNSYKSGLLLWSMGSIFSPCKQDQRIDAVKLWCWGRLLRVLWTTRRSNQSILKETNSEYSLKVIILKMKLQYFGHLMRRANSLEKTLILGKIEGRRRRGQQRIRCWMASSTQWTWVWASSGG